MLRIWLQRANTRWMYSSQPVKKVKQVSRGCVARPARILGRAQAVQKPNARYQTSSDFKQVPANRAYATKSQGSKGSFVLKKSANSETYHPCLAWQCTPLTRTSHQACRTRETEGSCLLLSSAGPKTCSAASSRGCGTSSRSLRSAPAAPVGKNGGREREKESLNTKETNTEAVQSLSLLPPSSFTPSAPHRCLRSRLRS